MPPFNEDGFWFGMYFLDVGIFLQIACTVCNHTLMICVMSHVCIFPNIRYIFHIYDI